jgi:hypothetical protein
MDSGSSAATFVVIVPNADQDAEKEGSVYDFNYGSSDLVISCQAQLGTVRP